MSNDHAGIKDTNCWVEIDREALSWNVGQLRNLAGPDRLLMAVVKANAYGHGMKEVAPLALEAGAEWLGVFSVDEGLELRGYGIDAPILVFGPTSRGRISEAFAASLRLTVASLRAADEIAELAPEGACVHLKVETGTNRQGLVRDEIARAIDLLRKNGAIVEGIYTHFADIEDTTDHRFAESQLALFEELVAATGDAKIPIPHAACSAATILFPTTYFQMVRVGIAMYGLWPSSETFVSAGSLGRNALDLRPVMTWKTRIAQIKSLSSGEFVGYGRTYRTTRPSQIALLPVGYSDGFDRRLGNGAYVLVNGARAPIRGRICMNLTMIDVTDIPDAAPGDEVVLLGSQGEENVSAEDLACQTGTINYETVTRIAPGAPRIVV
ncbi:MAG: alanine racemase [Deltaproteobacteria bacterium]|nr:alanine racemase [Deltaproteobacteria bacterium]